MSDRLYTEAQMREAMMLSAKHLHGVTDMEMYVTQHIDNLPTTQAPVAPIGWRHFKVRQAECKHEAYDALSDWCHDCQSVINPKDAYVIGYDRAVKELTLGHREESKPSGVAGLMYHGKRKTVYDRVAICRELEATASGESYYGNALYVARDLPELDESDRNELSRWLDGVDRKIEGSHRLQDVIFKIRDAIVTPPSSNSVREAVEYVPIAIVSETWDNGFEKRLEADVSTKVEIGQHLYVKKALASLSGEVGHD